MRVQTLIVLLLLGAGAVFAALNPAAVTKVEAISTPMGEYQAPLISVLLIVGAAALCIMLALGALGNWKTAAHRRALEALLDRHEREIAELKSRAFDEVSRKVEVLQQDISREFEDFRRILKIPAGPRDTQVGKAEMTRTS